MTFPITRRRLRLAGSIAAVTALTLAVAACSSTPAEPQEPVELRVLTWSSNEAQHEIFQEIADDFIAAYPDEVSKVTFDSVPLDEYPQALVTQVSGGQAPDLAWALNSYALEYVNEGVFADSTAAFDADADWDASDITANALDVWSKDGKTFAYPFSTQPFGVYVNLDLLEQAGQPNPRDLLASGDWTLDNVMEMADAVARETGQGGLQIQTWAQWIELATMWDSFGAEPWSKDGSEALFNSPEMVDFFTWVNFNMFEKKGIVRSGETFDFTAGTAAFKIHLMSTGGGLDGSFEWDYLPLPAGPDSQVNVINQAAIGALSQSAHPELASKFLAFFTNKTNAAKLSAFFPQPRTSLLTVDVLSKAAPFLNAEQIEGTVIKPAQDAVPLPVNVNYSSFASEVASALELISQPGADVEAILNELNETVQPMMSK